MLGYGGWVVGYVGRVGCVPGAAGVCGVVQVSCGGVGWVQGGWVVLAFGSRGWGSVGSVRVQVVHGVGFGAGQCVLGDAGVWCGPRCRVSVGGGDGLLSRLCRGLRLRLWCGDRLCRECCGMG